MSLGRIFLRPLPAHPLRILLVLFVVLRHVRRKRVIRVRCAQESLYRQQHGPDLQCRGPFICTGAGYDPWYPRCNRALHPPFRMSRQMRPSLSRAAVGHYVSMRKITTPHPSWQRAPRVPNQLTDIGMVYLGQEPHFGGAHGILLGKEQL